MSAIEHLLKPHVRDLGDFTVRRLLPAAATQTVGPFIFFDHMGPVQMPPGEGADVRPHPHIGLATVTYLFEGEIMHRDSLGSEQAIRPGDVNWMTAGHGIVHSERSPDHVRADGARLHGIQTWVALPKSHETDEPSFFHHPAATLPRVEQPGVRMVVIAGDAFGKTSPVKVFSRTLYVAIELDAGASVQIPAEHAERGIYPVDGAVSLDGEPLPAEHMVVLTPGQPALLMATAPSRVMLLGGDPTDGRRFIYWNFVASSKEAIEAAAKRWEDDQFPRVPGDERERIPLPARKP
ncbi:pirin family protein [Cupriavidus oxalaticus]|uniref:Pirin family protein n=1 Tax=Cupriavidus oxalaticus TaxID=96344 RepID=A0A976BC74_9BURK|nr:pirin family protein [Cupriavidus oxalaticus]QRQ87108.1 pirin family protein [Cupriavidus oxalaticus]QRQ94564.1 pirin family protein [Cupriavidus oxalaticus]WQD83210.1 pirin family protein [Cupriavidus oxalaticus]SPC14038.1 Pirin-like protein CC_3178 [Cupriavidus oxalaticus]